MAGEIAAADSRPFRPHTPSSSIIISMLTLALLREYLYLSTSLSLRKSLPLPDIRSHRWSRAQIIKMATNEDYLYGDLDDAVAKPMQSTNHVSTNNETMTGRLMAPPILPEPEEVRQLLEQTKQLKAENDTLKRNMGILYRTAKSELERKDRTIIQLQNELDLLRQRWQKYGDEGWLSRLVCILFISYLSRSTHYILNPSQNNKCTTKTTWHAHQWDRCFYKGVATPCRENDNWILAQWHNMAERVEHFLTTMTETRRHPEWPRLVCPCIYRSSTIPLIVAKRAACYPCSLSTTLHAWWWYATKFDVRRWRRRKSV